MTLNGQGRDPNMLRAQYLEIRLGIDAWFRRTPKEMAYGESNGHVTDGVM